MHKDIEDKIGNLVAQKQQVKLELSDLRDAALKREILLNKLDGAIEFAKSLEEDSKNKKEKQDA